MTTRRTATSTSSAETLAATLTQLTAPEPGTLVIGPPDDRPGSWAGAPCAVTVDGVVWLAYRLRHPVDAGRGFANVVARAVDGLAFETVAVVYKDAFGAASLERPALVVTPDGTWRLYVSCATPGTAHWRVDLLEAATPEGLASATPRTVLPGGPDRAVKDPVVVHHDGSGTYGRRYTRCPTQPRRIACGQSTRPASTASPGSGRAGRSAAEPGAGTLAARG